MVDEHAPFDEGGSTLIPAPGTATTESVVFEWITAAQLSETGGAEPDWLIRNFLACGAITDLCAKVKVGKTRLMLDAVRAIERGKLFLNEPTQRTPVVWLTEENSGTFLHAIARAELIQRDDLHILLRHKTRSLEWAAIATGAVEKCRAVGAKLLVVDTLSDWADLRGDDENSSGKALEAMQPLREAAATGLAVAVLRHDRKTGGAVGESGRGSSAFAGAADILFSLKTMKKDDSPTRRLIEGVGRFDGLSPARVLDLEDNHYIVIGEGRSAVRDDMKRRIHEALVDEETPLLVPELKLRIGGDVSDATLWRALRGMVAEGELHKVTGLGTTKRANGFVLPQ